MNTQLHTASARFSLRTLFAILAVSAHLTGCFVAVEDRGYDDDYYYEDGYYEDDYYHDVSAESHVSESFEEERFEEEHFEEEIIEETQTTTTTTVSEEVAPPAESIVESHPVEPLPVRLFEERFENPELTSVGHISIGQLSQWMIDWTPGSRCSGIPSSATIAIQSDIDLGDQLEVEGLQHARLDGKCGDQIAPTRLTTSLADVASATTLTFYARSAESAPDAELMVEWGDDVVMNEALLNGWAEYTINLTQTQRPSDALLTITALTPGVIIDHIRVD